MQLKSLIVSEGNKGETLQKPKKHAATENLEVFRAVCKWLDAKKISEDAAKSEEAAQSKQAAM